MGGSISRRGSEPDARRAAEVDSAGRPVHDGGVSPAGAAGGGGGAVGGGGSAVVPAGPGDPGGGGTAEAQRVVPTVFRWEHGGNNVCIAGTFNGWARKIPMHRSGNDFVYIQSLPPGRHAYKFVVDDEWRFAPDQPTVSDGSGNINNVVDLSGFQPDDDLPPPGAGGGRRDSLPGEYGHVLPEEEAYSKDPPLLPPHLRTIILNSGSPDAADLLQLPTPQHVCLNHLYCTAIRDGIMVQAVTQRYRKKHVSTVFYTLLPVSATLAAAEAAAAAAAAAGGAPGGQGTGAHGAPPAVMAAGGPAPMPTGGVGGGMGVGAAAALGGGPAPSAGMAYGAGSGAARFVAPPPVPAGGGGGGGMGGGYSAPPAGGFGAGGVAVGGGYGMGAGPPSHTPGFGLPPAPGGSSGSSAAEYAARVAAAMHHA